MKILNIRSLYDINQLEHVWEQSVRSSHNFLNERDILQLKPVIKQALLHINVLACTENMQAFIGINQEKIEMLFVHPEFQKQGLGRKLIQFALEKHNVKYVDVNEQNPLALSFYTHLGFKVYDRSDYDAQGRPFPILHLTLNSLKNEG